VMGGVCRRYETSAFFVSFFVYPLGGENEHIRTK
jgi:hypothetical protein